MKLSRSQLFHRSRDTRFLIRAAVGIAGISVVIAAAISMLTTRQAVSPLIQSVLPSSEPDDPISEPSAKSLDFESWARLIRHTYRFSIDAGDDGLDSTGQPEIPHFDSPDDSGPSEEGKEKSPPHSFEAIAKSLGESSLDEDERALLMELARGLLAPEEGAVDQASAELRRMAGLDPPRRFAAEFLGDIRQHASDYEGAMKAYRMEVTHFPEESEKALHQLIQLLRGEERLDELHELLSRPELRDAVSPYDRIDLAMDRRDYLGLLKWVALRDLKIDDPWLAVLSLFAAAIWFIIITQFSGGWRKKMWLYLAAFVLGFFSATLTIYAVVLQEGILEFTHDPEGDIVGQVIYCVAGIGLREETLKLLMFLPLVPILARRYDEIDALVCAGLVGLGFAFNENIGYVFRGGEFTTWARFLTANFLHIALTGVVGLALVRCWRRPRRQWDNFLYDFLIVIAAHGAYDALLMVPQFAGYGIISIVIYALIAYLFLDHATTLMRPQSSMTISPLAVFVIGSALLMGVVLCYACWGVPFRDALSAYLAGLGGMVPIAFLFINRLRAL